MKLNTILELLGALVGLVFIYVNIKSSKSLTGSFFKKYYRWVIIGAVFLILGFTTDVMGGWLGLSEDMTDSLHHAELLIFGIMFVYAARILPKEAAEYLKEGK